MTVPAQDPQGQKSGQGSGTSTGSPKIKPSNKGVWSWTNCIVGASVGLLLFVLFFLVFTGVIFSKTNPLSPRSGEIVWDEKGEGTGWLRFKVKVVQEPLEMKVEPRRAFHFEQLPQVNVEGFNESNLPPVSGPVPSGQVPDSSASASVTDDGGWRHHVVEEDSYQLSSPQVASPQRSDFQPLWRKPASPPCECKEQPRQYNGYDHGYGSNGGEPRPKPRPRVTYCRSRWGLDSL